MRQLKKQPNNLFQENDETVTVSERPIQVSINDEIVIVSQRLTQVSINDKIVIGFSETNTSIRF